MNDEVRTHYGRVDVRFEIAKACQWREVVAIGEGGAIRPMKMFRAQDVQFWFDRLQLWRAPFDWYHSMAYVNLPLLPNKLSEFGAMQTQLKASWDKLVRGWSYYLDIDVEGYGTPVYEDRFGEANAVTVEAVRWLQKTHPLHGPYYAVFSGTGWNVRSDHVPWGPDAQREVSHALARDVGVPLRSLKPDAPVRVDDGIYDLRRIIRVPFTVSRKSGLVVTPLTCAEAARCRLSDFRLDGYAWSVRDRLRLVNKPVGVVAA